MAILENHFYHKTISLYTAIFGNCFTDIKVVRSDGKEIKVPISYAAKQKYNVRNEENEDPDLVRFMKRTPRMSFRLTSWQRDSVRVKNKMHQLTNIHSVGLDGTHKVQYNRVPYIFTFSLDITTKYLDDMLQIFEQLAVSFNPSIQVVVKDNPSLDDQSAITITMNDSAMEDSFEGIYETGREITCTLNFTLEGYLYMPTRDGNIIKTVYINYYDLTQPDILLDSEVYDENDALTDEEKANGL